MSASEPYVPKHRQAPRRPLAEARQKAVRSTVLLSTIAVAGTGAAVAGGVAAGAPVDGPGADSAPVAADAVVGDDIQYGAAPEGAEADVDRGRTVSRSAGDRREDVGTRKQELLRSSTTQGNGQSAEEDIADEDPKTIASAMLSDFGWSGSEMSCLDSLWSKESGWQVNADNPTSSAYGIPQALPGSKMASAGADWATNPATQIEWGLGYIEDRYGSPCAAWGHSQANNWY